MLLLDIQQNCVNPIPKKAQQKVSILAASWKQIEELLNDLSYEPYIDDQVQIDEIWNTCNVLIKTNKLKQEERELCKKEDLLKETGSFLEIRLPIGRNPIWTGSVRNTQN